MMKKEKTLACSEVLKDYRCYQFSYKELLLLSLESIILTILISYLFYKSKYACITCVLIFPILVMKQRRKKIEKQKEELAYDFKDAMILVSTALSAGYSIENAFMDAQRELLENHKIKTNMLNELQHINTKASLNQPIEETILDFSIRSDVEDIQLFGQILFFAKRGGGDFIKIIKTATDHISEKMEVEREILIMIAQKKLEQKIMNVIPIFILLYMDITSPKYLEVLYHNAIGIGIMSACLVLYLFAVLLSEYLIDIKI